MKKRTKKLLSLLTAASLSISAFASFAVNAAAANDFKLTIGEESGKVTVTSTADTAITGVIIKATYEGAVLKAATVSAAKTFAAGEKTVVDDVTVAEGDKVFVWNAAAGDSSMTPLAERFEKNGGVQETNPPEESDPPENTDEPAPGGTEKVILSEDFSGTPGDFWLIETGEKKISTSVAGGALKAVSNATGGRTADITLPSDTGEEKFVRVKYDVHCENFNQAASNDADNGFTVQDKAGKAVFSLLFPNPRNEARNPLLNGAAVTDVKIPYRTAIDCSVEAVLNFNDHTFDYKIYEKGTTTVLASGTDVAMADADASNVGKLRISMNRNDNNNTSDHLTLDNFYLSTILGPSVTLTDSSDTIKIDDLNTPVKIADVADAETVNVTSEDTSVATVAYDEASGAVNVTGVANGKAAVSITATSKDGAVVRRTVNVAIGNVVLVTVAVKYMYNGEEIATGYELTDQAVGAVISADTIKAHETYKTIIKTTDYKYTNPSVADYTVHADDGTNANVINVTYANRAAAVTSINVSYKNGSDVVKTETIDMASGYYVGDEYTYVGSAYVSDEDGKIYAAGTDYTENNEGTVLNNASDPVNGAIKRTVLLTSPQTFEYSVTASKDAAFFGEWEDVLTAAGTNTTGSNFGNDRYVASGGKMCATSSTVEFYEVPATGFYQIVITGTSKRRGTAIFETKDLADAATSATDAKALVAISNNENNDAYGYMAASTVILTKGDKLTIKGFGTSNTTDNLDYILIRQVTGSDIIGAAGVSIVPGGQTSEYAFNPGVEGEITWTVEGETGATIENGVLTVPETATAGTATVKASVGEGDAKVEGSLEVTIAAPAFTKFDIVGNARVDLGLGTTTYTIANLIDQYGVDVTSHYVPTWGVEGDADLGASISNEEDTCGVLTVTKPETVTVKATIGAVTISKEVVVGMYSKVVENAAAGEVDLDGVISYGASTYTVTFSDGSTIVKTASDNKITLEESEIVSGRMEIVPNYKFNLGSAAVDGYVTANAAKADGYGFTNAPSVKDGTGTGVKAQGVEVEASKNAFEVDLPDGRYDITVHKADTKRTHIKVNGLYTMPEADYSDGPSPMAEPLTAPGSYTQKDVIIEGGVAKITANNWDKGVPLIAGVEITKKSDLEPRKTHIWIAGDSTVTNYRPTPSTRDDWALGTRRTGWGQLFEYYLQDSVIVDDYAHSGDYSVGWYNSTFPSVLQKAQQGDYFFVQFGINDRADKNNCPKEVMNEYLSKMVDECRAKGVIPVLITPQICGSQYGEKVGEHEKSTGSGNAGWFNQNKEVAKAKGALLIDLADISGDLWAIVGKTWVHQNYMLYNHSTNTQDDPQHMSYQGAKLVAQLVATEIYDQIEAGNVTATGESFAGIPVNVKSAANITYTDADDSTEKTVEREGVTFSLNKTAEKATFTSTTD